MKNIFQIIASILIPGSGHIINKKYKKGILILICQILIAVLLVWRVKFMLNDANVATSVKEAMGVSERLSFALEKQTFFTLFIIFCFIVVWVLSVVDVIRSSRGKKEMLSVFAVILIMFFSMGIQISQVNLPKLVTEFKDTLPHFKRILWPWEHVTESDIDDTTRAEANILVDKSENPPFFPPRVNGQPYLRAVPSYGKLAYQDNMGINHPGDTIILEGDGFKPNISAEIWWEDPAGTKFPHHLGGKKGNLTVMTDKNGSFRQELTLPYRLIPPSAVGRMIFKVKAIQKFVIPNTTHLRAPIVIIIEKVVETIFMGMIATFFGIIFAIPISFLAARNLMSGSIWSKIVYSITRTILNIIRSIEPLIWALIATVWVGMGPFAGVIALSIHSVAALGKLYSEAIENIDPGQIEAVQATGASKMQVIIYAIIPQMIPPFVSFTIYRWDINIRMSTIIGMVGGGGIGAKLMEHINKSQYEEAGFAMLLIALIVSILDYVSSRIRQKYI